MSVNSELPFSARYWVDEAGCWLWLGCRSNGYGTVTIEGQKHVAHRLSWELARGPIPDGLQIDHLCRNRRCVNPDHLEPVTCAVNIRRGLVAKLTMEAAREIRAEAARGVTQQSLADRFGVSRATIGNVVRGIRWREESEAA